MMKTLPAAEWRMRPGLDALLAALGSDAGNTRFVGGAVRDTLLGLPVQDIDLATRLTPGIVMARLAVAKIKAVPTGIAHGTVTAIVDAKPYEITTLRQDIATDGRHAIVAFTDDWRADAARRDFTINALYADPTTDEIVDYFGGLADLGTRTVRFIGDPLARIAEDHLRILRFFRFHARFGVGPVDQAALAACASRANDLMALSRERIADELLKLLALPNPAPTMVLMIGHGILKPVLPEMVSAHALSGLIAHERAGAVAANALRRFAALLPSNPSLAEAIANRLKLSKAQRKSLICIAQRHPADNDNPRALAYYVGTDNARDRLLLGGFGDAPLAGWQPPRLPLTGGDLITRGLAPGPDVAATLKAIEAKWVAQGFPSGAALERIVSEALA